MDQNEPRGQAIRRLRRRRDFVGMLVAYVVVNLFLVGVWLFTATTGASGRSGRSSAGASAWPSTRGTRSADSRSARPTSSVSLTATLMSNDPAD